MPVPLARELELVLYDVHEQSITGWFHNPPRHRLTQAQLSLERFPRLRTWYEKVILRPAFEKAVVSYRP
jgi:glutathione S-transferase